MKKLLLLLPMALVTSCSAGHDLMSDKPFRADCKAPEDWFSKEDLEKWKATGWKNLTRFDVDPSLSYASVQQHSKAVETWNVVVVSPREIRLTYQLMPGLTFLRTIDRESGKIRRGVIGKSGSVDFEKGSYNCNYTSL